MNSPSPAPDAPLQFFVDVSRIEAANDAFTRSDREMRADFDTINLALAQLHQLTNAAQKTTRDEITVLRLGILMFNAATASLRDARGGLYQPAFAQVRDIIETRFLLDYFKQAPEKIAEWVDSEADKVLFAPAAVRKALKKTDRIFVPRDKMYSSFCEYATHPTPQGFGIISPNMMTQMGPFPDHDRMKALLVDLAVHLVLGSLSFSGHVRATEKVDGIRGKIAYAEAIANWAKDRLPGVYDSISADLPGWKARLTEIESIQAIIDRRVRTLVPTEP